MSKPYQEEEDSTASSEGHEYQLNKLFELTQSRHPVLLPTNDLKWILKYTQVDKKRVEKADISAPLLVYKSDKENKFVTLDGAHRLTKAVQDGLEEVPVLVLSKSDLEHGLIKRKPPAFLSW